MKAQACLPVNALILSNMRRSTISIKKAKEYKRTRTLDLVLFLNSLMIDSKDLISNQKTSSKWVDLQRTLSTKSKTTTMSITKTIMLLTIRLRMSLKTSSSKWDKILVKSKLLLLLKDLLLLILK